MKAWSEDHPKAKLMARKRAAILQAARDSFLRDGYSGVSMDAIAAGAEVSIMTLYRHADSKEDLFVAVIQAACEHTPEEMQAMAQDAKNQALHDVLVHAGVLFQEKLMHADTIALFRVVMQETTRFPHLAEAAYREFVAAWEVNLDYFLSIRDDVSLQETVRRQLLAEFIDDLLGTDILRVLLGLQGLSPAQQHARAQAAADKFLARIPH